MSAELLETIKQQIALLTPQERDDLKRYLSEPMKQDEPKTAPIDEQAAEIKRRQHMEWLKTHREEYGGQYVALDGDGLVGTGKNFPEAAKAAKRAGVPDAFVSYVFPPDYVGEMGGW